VLGRRGVGALGVVGIVGVSLIGLVGEASNVRAGPVASVPNRWRVVASIPAVGMTAVVALSRQSAWAFGAGFNSADPVDVYPAGLRWNGHRWTKVSFPKSISTDEIGCAGASSATNARRAPTVWAFAGSYATYIPARAGGALQLAGGRWKLVKRFPAGIVGGCLVENPSEIWVFGDPFVLPGPGLGTWHLHGHTWTHVKTGGYTLGAASAIGADDVWAEGENSLIRPVAAHWNGRTWARNTQLIKALGKVASNEWFLVGGINALSRNDVWLRVFAVHNPLGKATVSTLVRHWTGRAWQKVAPADFGYYLPGAVRDGHGGWWADVLVNPLSQSEHTRLLHAVRGRWSGVPVSIRGCRSAEIGPLAPVPGSTSVLAVQECLRLDIANVLLYGPRL
jgi:hypothetical protein